MRGETCIAVATFFSFVALLLLIFAHVAQTSTSAVPRKLYMAEVNVTNYGTAFRAGTGVNAPGLYTNNATSPLQEGYGLRQLYAWGIYGWCAYLEPGPSNGRCYNQTFGAQYRPFDVFLADIPSQYQEYSRVLIPDNAAFKNSGYLGGLTHSGFDLLFVATLATFAALVTGLIKHKVTFLLASLFSITSWVLLLVGSAIWTSAIGKSEDINTGAIRIGAGTPLGIHVQAGGALYLFWAAFVLDLIASIPYTISCWSFLKR